MFNRQRKFQHLSPRYVFNRINERYYYRTNQHRPWLVSQATDALSNLLQPDDIGLEFGSGRSTYWFAQKVGKLISIEHHEGWFNKVTQELRQKNLQNVDLHLHPTDPNSASEQQQSYVQSLLAFPEAHFDLVLVDGVLRDHCAQLALDRVKPGGLLVIDDVHRYLPSTSISPYARTQTDGPASESWNVVWNNVSGWRHIWTSNGVSDTAIFIKPCTASAATN